MSAASGSPAPASSGGGEGRGAADRAPARPPGWEAVTEAEIVQLLSSIPKRTPWIMKWQLLRDFIRPYEPDWRAYTDKAKYAGVPVVLEVHPFLARHGGQIKMQEGLLKLGFVRVSDSASRFFLDHKLAQEKIERHKHDKKRMKSILSNSSKREKQHVTWNIPHLGMHGSLSSSGWPSPAAADDVKENSSLLSVSVSGDGGTSFCGTSTSEIDDGDVSDLQDPAAAASESGSVSRSQQGSGRPAEPFSKEAECLREQVRELTRQVRMLRAASLAAPAQARPTAPFIIKRNYIAPVSGNYPVRLQVNFLDPDLAPYRVAIQLRSLMKGSGWHSPPCSVLDHQYVVFLAPPNPPGSYPVTLFGTTDTGQLKKYCPSTWLEYQVDDELESGDGSLVVPPATATRAAAAATPSGHSLAERQSCIKGSARRSARTGAGMDRKSSVASQGSISAPPAAAAAAGGTQSPSTLAVLAGTDGKEVTLSLPSTRREGLTHHQINEHNALNIITPGAPVDPSEGPDTFDPTSDLKSHSEMKSEFTSDIAEEEDTALRDEDEYEVFQTRQFRALLPTDHADDAEHPPLTKEMLEMLTLGRGWDKADCMNLPPATMKHAFNVMSMTQHSKGGTAGGSQSAAASVSLRSTSPLYSSALVAVDVASSPRSSLPPSNHLPSAGGGASMLHGGMHGVQRWGKTATSASSSTSSISASAASASLTMRSGGYGMPGSGHNLPQAAVSTASADIGCTSPEEQTHLAGRESAASERQEEEEIFALHTPHHHSPTPSPQHAAVPLTPTPSTPSSCSPGGGAAQRRTRARHHPAAQQPAKKTPPSVQRAGATAQPPVTPPHHSDPAGHAPLSTGAQRR
eukprot:TRINITY_DN1921_c0_g2_i1.p1 TRINITY_DN1921_c0_g2~~TRINITY_DN1921_c0_g2_i1.p1  ORF type:complete len:874 (+),score=269.07 TRINITY_DN1921_c0_g2_i1:58-2622(+)